MPSHVPGNDPDTLAEYQRILHLLDAARPMPPHRIAYYLVVIQVALIINGLMLWADATHHGPFWANLAIALTTAYLGFTAHYRLWRGR